MSSIIPLLLNLVDDPLESMYGGGDHSFGQVVHPKELHRFHTYNPLLQHHHYASEWPSMASLRAFIDLKHKQLQEDRVRSGASKVIATTGNHGFQVHLDVKHFAPNEITVKVKKQQIIVEAKHEEKEDSHGHIFRHFVRKYRLPDEFDSEDVISSLSSDGILTLTAAHPNTEDKPDERIVQIHQTGPAHSSVRDNSTSKEA